MFSKTRGAFTHTISAPPVPEMAAVTLAGQCLGQPTELGLDDSQLARGILLLGAARSGKSVIQGRLLRQLLPRLRSQDCLAILDTKGEYAKTFFRPGDLILGTGGPYAPTVGWNLLKDCVAGCGTESQLEQRIGMIAGRVFCKENLQTPYFTDAPRRVLEELLKTLLYHPELLPKGEVLDNHGLLSFLRQGDWNAFLASCSAPQEMRSYIGADTGTAHGRTPAEKSVLAELQINVATQLCGRWGGHGSFSMIEFEQNRAGHTLFLQYDPRDGGAADQVYQLLIDLLLTGLMTGKHRDGKLYLFLDEAHLLGQAPELLIRALNYGPGIGLGTICIGTQSLAQLQQLCGEAETAALLAGLQTRIMFHTEDQISTTFVREQCGTVQTAVITYVPGIAYNALAGQTEPAVTDMELNTMGVGQAIIKLPSYPAFFFHFAP